MPMLWRSNSSSWFWNVENEYIWWAQRSYNKICDKSECLKDDEKESLKRH